MVCWRSFFRSVSFGFSHGSRSNRQYTETIPFPETRTPETDSATGAAVADTVREPVT